MQHPDEAFMAKLDIVDPAAKSRGRARLLGTILKLYVGLVLTAILVVGTLAVVKISNQADAIRSTQVQNTKITAQTGVTAQQSQEILQDVQDALDPNSEFSKTNAATEQKAIVSFEHCLDNHIDVVILHVAADKTCQSN